MATILALRHVPYESLGMLERVFGERGLEFRYVDVWANGLPACEPERTAGVVVLGGPMNVDEVDKYPFLRDEPGWMRRMVEAEVPLVGICLGSQLLAKAFGARVYPAAKKEIGWYDFELLPAAADDPLFAGLPAAQHVFQWHGDTFDLPDGTVHLARSAAAERQAFRAGRAAWGLQFHAEITPELIEDWLEEPAGRCEIAALDYIDPAVIRRETAGGLARMKGMAETVFGRFAELCAGRSAAMKRE